MVVFQTNLQVTFFSLSHKVLGAKRLAMCLQSAVRRLMAWRPFGSIRDAVVRVLDGEPLGLRARDVHARVELLLGERVSRGSVKAILAARCHGDDRLFVRINRGRYRLQSGDGRPHYPEGAR